MRIQATEAQVWWIAIVDEIRPHEGLAWQTWFEAIQQTFRFIQAPTELPKLGLGFEFKEGHLEDDQNVIGITSLQVYQDGFSIFFPSNTRNAEKALQAALETFYSLGFREPLTPPLHYYVSTIVADFDRSLDALIPEWLLKTIASTLPIEGENHFLLLQTNLDATKIEGRAAPVNPTNFRIERRAGVPYEQNRYFCQANTTTEKHINLLEEIERRL